MNVKAKLWVVEADLDDGKGYAPCSGYVASTRSGARDARDEWRSNNPDDPCRIRKYVSAEAMLAERSKR
jgi:hypothetical protein